MIKKRKSYIVLGMLSAFIFLLIITSPLSIIGSESFKGKQPWEVWDYSKWGNPVRGGYYRTATSYDVGLLCPHHWPVNSWSTLGLCYEIVCTSAENYRNVPYLVEGWEFPDSVTCIMKVKPGINFHDGAPFNAEAIKYNLEWIKNKKNGCWDRAFIRTLKSMEILDEYTIKYNFKKPWASFLGFMRNTPGFMISPTLLKKGKKPVDTQMSGTASFMLEDRSPGNWIKFKRNPNWWFAKASGNPDMPYFDGWIKTIIPDKSVQLANLKAGKIHSMTLDKSQYATLKKNPHPDLTLYVWRQNTTSAFYFNTAKGPCKDIRVRKAISHAIDREALIAGTQHGLARIASCIFPGDHWAHNPKLKPVEHDLTLSKKLLAEAGYPDGLKLKGVVGITPEEVSIGEAIKNMLATVGIKWAVESLDTAAWTDKLKNLEYDFIAGGWVLLYEPDEAASGLYLPSGFNFGRSRNEKAIELIHAARVEMDEEKRKQLYWDLETVLYNNYEDAWLWWEMTPAAYRKNVLGRNNEMSQKYGMAWSRIHPLWFKDGKP